MISPWKSSIIGGRTMKKSPFLNSRIIEEDMQDIYGRGMDWQRLYGKTVLITGAAGMLASYVVFFLIYLNEYYGADIRMLLHVRSGEKARARFDSYLEKSYTSLMYHDLCESWRIEENIDFIIHTASLASPQYYGTIPVEVAAPNVLGTYYLLQLAQEKNIESFLFFSSGDVYGKLQEGMGEIRESDFGASDPMELHSCYGESKRMGETWCKLFCAEYSVPAKVVRIAHTYAPTMDIERDPRVFASFMRCVRDGTDILMYSDGSACRPFCYITDAVAGFFLVLFAGTAGQAYNVSNDQAFLSIYELAQTLLKLRPELDCKVIAEKRSKDTAYLENRLNRANLPSADKLRTLGWQCHYGVEEGFSRVWHYLQELPVQTG